MDKRNKVLYVITNISMPHLVKIGVTNDLDKRLRELNKTSVPTRFQVYQSFDQLENVEILEQEILRVFSEKRVNRRREFIEEHPERICDFIRENKNLTKEKDVAGLFEKIGIKKGTLLKFTDGERIYPNITVTVDSGRNVIFEGTKQSLSKSALTILNRQFDRKWSAARGTVFWTHNGKTIADLQE